MRLLPCILPFLLASAALHAQDTRTVTEPVFPATCTSLAATQAISAGEPGSETSFDTSRLQTALNACPAGQAVELTTDSTGTSNAFLIAPINIPKGVTLIVDAGVTVFASRNPADYQSTASGAETCGTVGTKGNGCNPLITVNNGSSSTGAGIMGYGIINGRGGDTLIVNGVAGTATWWSNANLANGNGAQNNPILLFPQRASSFTLYKITLKNSAMFHVKYQYGDGFTVWGVKIVTPFNARNTDGIDPDDRDTNITIANSYISDGDDDIALGASGSGNLVANVSILNDHTYGGHGVSIGSYTSGGISNVQILNLNQSADIGDSNSAGIKIKSSQDRGGLVSNISYQNVCMQNHRYPVQFNPVYNTSSGTSYPSYQNIALHNVTVLTSGTVQLQGLNANYPLGLTLDNVNFAAGPTLSPAPQYASIKLGPGPVTPVSLTNSTGTGVTYTNNITNPTQAPYSCTSANFPSLVGELFLSTAANTSNATAGNTNQQTLSVASGTSFTLNAVVENTDALSAAPTAQVQLLEGSTVVGSAALAGNGTLAQVTVANASTGVHTYIAQYPGDSSHAALSFGSVQVTVAPPTALPATTTTLSAPAAANFGTNVTLTATVAASSGNIVPSGTVTFMNGAATLGSATLLNGAASFSSTALAIGNYTVTAVYAGSTAFATSTSNSAGLTISATPQTITTSTIPAVLTYGSTPLSLTASSTSGLPVALAVTGPVTLTGSNLTFTGAGTVTITATQAGNGTYAAATPLVQTIQVAAAPLTVTPANASITFNSAIPTLTGNVAGLVNGDSVTATYATTATAASLPGQYAITATLVDPNGRLANYTVTSLAGTLTISQATQTISVTGAPATLTYGAPAQTIAATATSGLPVALAVSGPATLSGTTLSVAGSGTITLTATQSGNTSYTAATPVISTIQVAPAPLTVTPASASIAYHAAIPALTGTLAGLVNGDSISATYATTASSTSAPGQYPITATLADPNSRLPNYTVANTPATLTIVAASTSIVINAVSSGTFAGEQFGLFATVTSPTGAPANGFVTFYNGTGSVGTATVSNGVASYQIPTITAGTYSFTAVYTANTSYTQSSSTALNVSIVQPVALALSSQSLSLAASGSGSSTLTLTPAGGFTGNVTLACSSPVAYVTCTVPSTAAISGAAAITTPVTIAVAATAKLNFEPLTAGPARLTYAALLPLGALLLLPLLRARRRINTRVLQTLCVFAVLWIAATLTGCGGGSSAPITNRPPAGNQTVTITATAAGISQSTTLTVNVTN